MKILSICDVVPGTNIDLIRGELLAETRAAWSLFEAGVLREAYVTASPGRVILMLEVESIKQAEERLQDLPLVAKSMLRFELIELRPFLNWSRLFAN